MRNWGSTGIQRCHADIKHFPICISLKLHFLVPLCMSGSVEACGYSTHWFNSSLLLKSTSYRISELAFCAIQFILLCVETCVTCHSCIGHCLNTPFCFFNLNYYNSAECCRVIMKAYWTSDADVEESVSSPIDTISPRAIFVFESACMIKPACVLITCNWLLSTRSANLHGHWADYYGL